MTVHRALYRTSESHPLYVDFIQGVRNWPVHGRLGLTFAPGKWHPSPAGDWKRDIHKDLSRLKEYWQTDLLVSLIEKHEFQSLRIPALLDLVTHYGMETLWFPIRDQSIPASMDDFADVVTKVSCALQKGKTVIIHCMGGLGRSGLVAACVIVSANITPEEAIATIRKVRAGAIQTPEQERYVFSYHKYLRQRSGLQPL